MVNLGPKQDFRTMSRPQTWRGPSFSLKQSKSPISAKISKSRDSW